MKTRSLLSISTAGVAGALLATVAVAQDQKPPAPPTNKQEWTGAVRTAFAAKKPDIETIHGVTGDLRTELAIVVRPNGSLADVTVKRASSFQPVDDAAVAMIRSAGRLPSFTRDMERKDMTLALPVAFRFDPRDEADRRLFIDSASGLRIALDAPLMVSAAPPAGSDGEVAVQISTGKDGPAYALPGEPLCEVALRKAAADAPTAQDELNTPERVEWNRLAMIERFDDDGLEVDRSNVTDYRSARLIELILKPKPDVEQPERRIHISSFDWPGGAVAVSCATTEQHLTAALPMFQSIRDGVSVP